jgi:hypothetical protein
MHVINEGADHDAEGGESRGGGEPSAKSCHGLSHERNTKACHGEAQTLRAGAWEQIGKNHIGHTLYEDQRGIRSYIVAGVRRTEPVRIIPTYEGMKTAHVERTDEWKTESERKAAADEAERALQAIETAIAQQTATPTDGRCPPRSSHARNFDFTYDRKSKDAYFDQCLIASNQSIESMHHRYRRAWQKCGF